jgi:hypothetical protein
MINVAFTPNELVLLVAVVEHAADEFSNHGCNEVDVTKLGLTSAAADELREAMAKANVIDEEQAVDCQGNKYLHDDTLLRFLYKKLKDMMGLSGQEAEARGVVPLLRAGLAAKLVSANPLRISGGRSLEETDGFKMYKEGFTIWEDPDTHLYYAEKKKAKIGERSPAFRTPEEIAQWVIDLYSGKIKSPTQGRSSIRGFRCP